MCGAEPGDVLQVSYMMYNLRCAQQASIQCPDAVTYTQNTVIGIEACKACADCTVTLPYHKAFAVGG